jgi:NADH dehydrogenase
MAKEKVLIVGGGFAGVKLARELADDDHFSVTLLSDDTHLRYYPTLYLAATGSEPATASLPLGTIFQDNDVKLVKGKAKTLDRKTKTITTEDGDAYRYDTLILALGVVTNYFGIQGLDQFSYSIKSQAEVARFKQHLHEQLMDTHKPDLNYIVIGAGPTGIELAGELPGYLRHIIKCHGLKAKTVHIDLIEAMPRLLPSLPKSTSNAVRRRLKRLGVRLYLNSKVEGETIDALTINGKPVRSHSVVWTAGVTNNPFFKDNNFALMGHGKVGVDTYLQAEPDIYVLGDNANTPYSGMAQTALHDAAFVATNLKRKALGKKLNSYSAEQPISVIPVGPRWAAVQWGKVSFHGLAGYLLRSVADLKGFHDFEPWPKAVEQYLSEYVNTEDCKICATVMRAS